MENGIRVRCKYEMHQIEPHGYAESNSNAGCTRGIKKHSKAEKRGTLIEREKGLERAGRPTGDESMHKKLRSD